MEGFLNPNEVLNQLKLREDMTAADFGSGSGGWALPLAKKLGEGKIYAIDILEEPLSALKDKAKLEKVINIETIQSDVESRGGSRLMNSSCDLILMTNLLFECEDKKKILEEGKRVLRKGGRILVVDWKENASLGPEQGRISAEEVKKISGELDLKLEKEFEVSIYHYGLILVK